MEQTQLQHFSLNTEVASSIPLLSVETVLAAGGGGTSFVCAYVRLCSQNYNAGGAGLRFLCGMEEVRRSKTLPHLIEILRYKRIFAQRELTGSIHHISS